MSRAIRILAVLGTSTALLVGGDDEAIAAEVLGVSECSGLAVIKLDDEGPWPYLDISDEAPRAPLEVFALGFPAGGPEYTVTQGVVSRVEAEGETQWASVASVIEHDAAIQPGISGGPLVTEDAMVVGVNHTGGGNEQTTTQHFYAISSDLAGDLVENPGEGDELSIGVNGTAVVDEENGVAGVWVNALDVGGPAGSTGLQPGDIITNLHGVQLDSGTMEEYCDVLRSASEGDPLSVRVLRPDTSEELEGELHGDELSPTYSFATNVGDRVEQGDDSSAVTIDEYVAIQDDTGRIATMVPDAWSEVSTSPQDLAGIGTPQPTLFAAPSLADFDASTGPGVGIVAIDGFGSVSATVDEVLAGAVRGSGCAEEARDTYDNGLLVGPYAVTDCGGLAGIILTAALSTDPDVLVLVLGVAASDNDLAVLDEVLADLIVS